MNVRISQILRTKRLDVVIISPDASIRSAIGVMKQENVGALVVVDVDQHLLGVVSERDVIHGLASEGADLLGSTVRKVMRTDGPVANLDDTVLYVMQVMTAARARHVPVVDGERTIGVVSLGDVVKSRLDETIQENGVLQDLARVHLYSS
jgi:CBS domain-containing protein